MLPTAQGETGGSAVPQAGFEPKALSCSAPHGDGLLWGWGLTPVNPQSPVDPTMLTNTGHLGCVLGQRVPRESRGRGGGIGIWPSSYGAG